MKKIEKMLMMTGIASMMSMDQSTSFNRRDNEVKFSIPKEPKPPKGSKTYFFDSIGLFSTEQMRRDECVFKCFALNDKNAKRKFNNWKNR
tara:strand:+ start:695 stop:964 length:270 start_codon:yes stop_codon:yes gene_type:complete